MPDADFRSTAVRAAGAGERIALTDILFAANPADSDFATAARADTLAQIIATIFENPPGTLTPAQQMALRMLISVLNEGEVDARDGTAVH